MRSGEKDGPLASYRQVFSSNPAHGLGAGLFYYLLVLAGITIFLFMGMGNAKGQSSVLCDVHSGSCRVYLSDYRIVLNIEPKPVKAMRELTFTLSVEGKISEKTPHIDLSMPGMNMGRNRIILKEIRGGTFQGTGIIVRCPSGRRTWKATLTVPEMGTAEFVFDVIY